MEIRIFNTLKATDIKVSGWTKATPTSNQILIVQGAVKIDEKKWLQPIIVVPGNLYQLHIKLENCRTGLTFEHDFYNYNQNICIGWLRPGNLGDDNVNWFFKGDGDDWHYGGAKGRPINEEHKSTCGNHLSTGNPNVTTPRRTFGSFKRPVIPTHPVTPSRPSSGSSSIAASPTDSDADRRRKINEYMNQLRADNKLLAYIEKGSVGATSLEGGKYLEVKERVEWNSGDTSYNMLSNASNVYPGALLIVDDNINTLNPTVLNIARGKVNIRIENFNNVEMGCDSVVASSSQDTNIALEVDHAIDKILSNFYKSGVRIPAKFHGNYKTFSSYREADLSMNASASFCGASLGASYDSSKKAYKSITILDFSQNYYTVKADFAEGDFSQLFGPNVTVDMIKAKVKNNALLFVNSVTYGRRAFYTTEVESNSSSVIKSAQAAYSSYVKSNVDKTDKKLELSFKANYIVEGGSTNGAENILKNCKANINASEGPEQMDKALAALHTSVKNAETAIDDYLSKGFNIDRNTQGVMLSYSTQFICSNPVAAQFNSTGSYIKKSIIPVHDVEIVFRNNRGATRHISIAWKTYRFDTNGKEILTPHFIPITKVGEKSTKNFVLGTLGGSKQIKDIEVTIWDREGDEIVTNGKYSIDGYATEECYYFIHWNNPVKAEKLDKAHFDARKSMDEEV